MYRKREQSRAAYKMFTYRVVVVIGCSEETKWKAEDIDGSCKHRWHSQDEGNSGRAIFGIPSALERRCRGYLYRPGIHVARQRRQYRVRVAA